MVLLPDFFRGESRVRCKCSQKSWNVLFPLIEIVVVNNVYKRSISSILSKFWCLMLNKEVNNTFYKIVRSLTYKYFSSKERSHFFQVFKGSEIYIVSNTYIDQTYKHTCSKNFFFMKYWHLMNHIGKYFFSKEKSQENLFQDQIQFQQFYLN